MHSAASGFGARLWSGAPRRIEGLAPSIPQIIKHSCGMLGLVAWAHFYWPNHNASGTWTYWITAIVLLAADTWSSGWGLYVNSSSYVERLKVDWRDAVSTSNAGRPED
jgi:hypothetical protein